MRTRSAPTARRPAPRRCLDRLAERGCRLPPGPRPQRRDAALTRQHPVRPPALPARRARQRGLPFPRRHRHAGHDAQGRRAIARAPSSARSPSTPGSASNAASTSTTTASTVRRGRWPCRSAAPPTPWPRRKRWLAEGDGRPTFCWIHLYDPHAPYVPPEPFASRHSGAPYVGEVAATDAALEPVLRPLLDAATPRTLVVITADHGESLGEHGERTHGLFAYEATLRVPLIVFAPTVVPPAAVDAVVGHDDIVPDRARRAGPGRSRRPAGAEPPAPRRRRAARRPGRCISRRCPPPPTAAGRPLTGVLRDGEKYIELPLPELYDLAADPGEQRNLVAVALGTRGPPADGPARVPVRGGVPGRATAPKTARRATRCARWATWPGGAAAQEALRSGRRSQAPRRASTR